MAKNRSSHKKHKHTKKAEEYKDEICTTGLKFEEYIGHTVTLYINAGGMAGNGFTGVLMGYTSTIVKLLILPQATPLCSIGDKCKNTANNVVLCMSCPFNSNAALSRMAEITISSITAFVHNK
jgi:hypothetical protein